MAKIILIDGTERQVEYNQAAKIYQILSGKEKAGNAKQQAFCEQVKDVIFDHLKKNDVAVNFKERYARFLKDHDIDLDHPKYPEEHEESTIRLPYKN